MSEKITVDSLMSTFPEALAKDKNMYAIGHAIASVLAQRLNEIDRIRIYSNIQELPETLLDILAKDLKVDWYGYDYPVEVKRNQIESSIMVHRRLGTKGSVDKALSDIYPGSTVQEWYEYGGRPFYFRVVLDLTNQIADISNEEVLRKLSIYKPKRAELEDDMIAYRSSSVIAITLRTDVQGFDVRRCGTPLDSLF